MIQNPTFSVVLFRHTDGGNHDVFIERNHARSLPFGTIKVHSLTWLYQNDGRAIGGIIQDDHLNNARNAIHELYCEVA